MLQILFISLQLGTPEEAARPPMVEAGTYITSERFFAIPVDAPPSARQEIQRLNLFLSRDKGKSWNLISVIGPEEKNFIVATPDDGSYWFAVQALMKNGKVEPEEKDIRVDQKMWVQPRALSMAARPRETIPWRADSYWFAVTSLFQRRELVR